MTGSLTAWPIIDNIAGGRICFVPTNVDSITDGQSSWESNLFNRRYPAPAV